MGGGPAASRSAHQPPRRQRLEPQRRYGQPGRRAEGPCRSAAARRRGGRSRRRACRRVGCEVRRSCGARRLGLGLLLGREGAPPRCRSRGCGGAPRGGYSPARLYLLRRHRAEQDAGEAGMRASQAQPADNRAARGGRPLAQGPAAGALARAWRRPRPAAEGGVARVDGLGAGGCAGREARVSLPTAGRVPARARGGPTQ
mmetsp:Transcript_49691/g.144486  ORF Transcript_49691/g.144486 Transcript_49691/m.144486 type:complete len:200 (-) Transcript_49691:450-1049(-)